jgi:hypothetical protein
MLISGKNISSFAPAMRAVCRDPIQALRQFLSGNARLTTMDPGRGVRRGVAARTLRRRKILAPCAGETTAVYLGINSEP